MTSEASSGTRTGPYGLNGARPQRYGPLPERIRHRFPIFNERVYINSCSQGALSDAVRASYEQYLDDWDEKGPLGVLGRAPGGRPSRLRRARQRGSGRDRRHDVPVGGSERARQRPPFHRNARRSSSPTGSSRPSGRSGTRRSRAVRASSTFRLPRTARSRSSSSSARSTTTPCSSRSLTSATATGRWSTCPRSSTWHTSGARSCSSTPSSRSARCLSTSRSSTSTFSARAFSSTCSARPGSDLLLPARARRTCLADADRLVRGREHLRDGSHRLFTGSYRCPLPVGDTAGARHLRGDCRHQADAGDWRRRDAGARPTPSTHASSTGSTSSRPPS